MRVAPLWHIAFSPELKVSDVQSSSSNGSGNFAEEHNGR